MMKKMLSLVLLCLVLTIMPGITAAAEEPIMDKAQALLDAGDYEAAVPLLEEAAGQGDALAQNELGKCYTNGKGVAEDNEKAVKYYRLAAGQGFAKSQFNLANCYLYGVGVGKDPEEGMAWLTLAAKQSLPQA